MIEPIVIKAGDPRVLLGGTAPNVDCRVVADQKYRAMKEENERLKSIVRAVAEGAELNPSPPKGCDPDSFQIGYGAAFTYLLSAIEKEKQ